jgi:4-alpha-glucanotransferase
MATNRANGLLLHITSLPSKYGIGDFGPEAFRFAGTLGRAGQKFWQVLPLNPFTLRENPYSPYNGLSAFAGNTMLISPDLLYREGLLSKTDLKNCPAFSQSRVEYPKVVAYKTKLLNAAYERFKSLHNKKNYERFCFENAGWLNDFTMYIALREHFWPRIWRDWPVELRERWEKPLKAAKEKLHDSISREKFLQYLFFEQWFALKEYCNQSGIKIIGDIPIYVDYESADVWARPEIFKLNRYRGPEFVSGVPPDMFSKTGQLWGNPVYNWLFLKRTGYSWWFERLRHNLSMFDRLRIDHFRGFFRYWRVRAGSKTALKGKWAKGPGKEFLDAAFKRFPKSAVIAEDLGYITPDVKSYVEESGLAGMRVLQFGLGGNPKTNPHFPANVIKNSICYTGTHDNNTIVGWFTKEINKQQKDRLFECLSHRPKANEFHWELIRLVMSSEADLVIIPVQDILGLGDDARMNHPGHIKGNWQWRFQQGQITPQITTKLAKLTSLYGRI